LSIHISYLPGKGVEITPALKARYYCTNHEAWEAFLLLFAIFFSNLLQLEKTGGHRGLCVQGFALN
jgi:hypothetical protein